MKKIEDFHLFFMGNVFSLKPVWKEKIEERKQNSIVYFYF